jgi:hypothetical protein
MGRGFFKDTVTATDEIFIAVQIVICMSMFSLTTSQAGGRVKNIALGAVL